MTLEKQEVAARASSIKEEYFQQFGLTMAPAASITKKTDTGGRLKDKSGNLVDGSVTLETLDIPVFATSAEALSSLGEATVVKLINAQNKTNMMNSTRVKYTGKTSNSAYEAEANAQIWQDDSLKSQAQAIYTDTSTTPQQKQEKYNALLDTVIAQIKQQKAQGGAAVADDTADASE